jgi:D-sedoheptulose 7-phosphate isomerase
LNNLIECYPKLECCKNSIIKAKDAIIECYERGGKLILCGNGGSSADCDHISGELMKGFLQKRPLSETRRASMKNMCTEISDATLEKLQDALPAIPLPSLTALNTAFCNDVAPELIYAQGVLALASKGDTLLAISTSGNSKNIIEAAKVAKALGVTVISLTGCGGILSNLSHINISVPERETHRVQELHIPIYHYICAAVEKHFFND